MEIDQIIDQMEDIASTATRVPGLRKRVMVDLERLVRVGEELKTSIPSDVQEAKEIVNQKESIINQAHLESRRVKEAAEQEAMAVKTAAEQEATTVKTAAEQEHLARVDETEIMRAAEVKGEQINQKALQESQQIAQDAQGHAYRIQDEADMFAAARREGADQYAREALFALEERLSELLAQVRRGIDALGVVSAGPAAKTNGSAHLAEQADTTK